MSEQDPLLPSSASHSPDFNSYLEGQVALPETRYERAKKQTAEALESTPLHYAVISLVLIDSACVLADLAYTFLSSECTPIEGPDTPIWLNVLAEISLAITTLFLVEIPISVWALGADHYNPFSRDVPHAVLHFFDAVVILVTFLLEVGLRGRERELASLLVILRLWRLVKLVQGIAVSAGEIGEDEARELVETQEQLKGVLADLRAAREEISVLRLRVAQLEANVDGDDEDNIGQQ